MASCPACRNEMWRIPHNCTDGAHPASIQRAQARVRAEIDADEELEANLSKNGLDLRKWAARCIMGSYPFGVRASVARSADEYIGWLDGLPTTGQEA